MEVKQGLSNTEPLSLKERLHDKKVVFISGNFNLVHPGHIRLFRFAKECGDYLVVGVHSDAMATVSLLPESLRLEGVRAISWVDEVVLLKEPVEGFLQVFQPDVVIKGKEHEEKWNVETEIVTSYGGKLLFGSGDVFLSSSELLRQAWESRVDSNFIEKPKAFQERHSFSFSDLRDLLKKISGLRVVVIGDTIVDEYISCDPLGMSQEDPTIVVTPIDQRKFIGGAAIVACHAAGLGAKVSFFSCIGSDTIADFVRRELEKYGVDYYLVPDESRPTSLKQRYRVHGKTLLRVSHLRQHGIDDRIREALLKQILDRLKKTDIVLFADFNYGLLTQHLLDDIMLYCQKFNIPMCADSQASSQMADITRFKGQLLITPTEREARLGVHDQESGLVVLAEKVARACQAKHVLLTLGADGVLIHSPLDLSQPQHEWVTDRLSALNHFPKDVAGAGDSFFTTASLSLCSGADIWQASYLGAIAAALQVSRIGNRPLVIDELFGQIG